MDNARKTKKLIIYYQRQGGRILVNATKVKNGKFVTKSPASKYGKPLSPNVSNEDIGSAVRDVLRNCD